MVLGRGVANVGNAAFGYFAPAGDATGVRPVARAEQKGDAQLMAAVAGGNEAALQAVYDRYAALIFTVAVRIVGDRQLAEEVVQDVFLRCWTRAARFDPARGSLPGWLMVITRNGAIDLLRSARRSPPLQLPAEAEDPPPAAAEGDFA